MQSHHPPLFSHSPTRLFYTFFLLKSLRPAPLSAPATNNIFSPIHWGKVRNPSEENFHRLPTPNALPPCICMHTLCFPADNCREYISRINPTWSWFIVLSIFGFGWQIFCLEFSHLYSWERLACDFLVFALLNVGLCVCSSFIK